MIRHKSGTRWPDDQGSGDAICDTHCTRGGDEKCGFFGLASKPVATVC
jgi:hypothetical protein